MYVCKNAYKNMIKIGVFGITDETIALTGLIKKEKAFTLTGVHPFPNAGNSVADEHSIPVTGPEELLLSSDLLVFSDPYPDDLFFIRSAIRMSRSLFFLHTAHLTPQILQEVQDLAQEGEVPVHCYNPLRDHPLFQTALEKAGRPFFTEIIRHWPANAEGRSRITSLLLHSVETTLHLNKARPRRPVAGACFPPDVISGILHVQMEFNDGMTALIRHELTDAGETDLCRITGERGTLVADLQHHLLRSPVHSSPSHRSRRKNLKGDRSLLLYQCFHNFASQRHKHPPALLEERIHAARLTEYILEKIHNKTLTPIPVENSW